MYQFKFLAPGTAIAILKDDKFTIGIGGVSNITNNCTVTIDTRFLCASISKLFTGLAILILHDQGKLNLDQDINKYLEIKIKHPYGLPITTRKLLLHKSGLLDDESGLLEWCYLNAADRPSLKDHIKNNLSKETRWSSDPQYHYSNAGFTLLGYLIEEVSKISFQDFIKQNIFDPLGITTASWEVPLDLTDVAVPHSLDKTPYGHYSVAEYPAAQLRISINDLFKFLKFFINHQSDPKLISLETMKMMLPDNFKDGLAWWGKNSSYGIKSEKIWTHGGYMKGVRTHIYYYPHLHAGFIILTNGENSCSEIIKQCKNIMNNL